MPRPPFEPSCPAILNCDLLSRLEGTASSSYREGPQRVARELGVCRQTSICKAEQQPDNENAFRRSGFPAALAPPCDLTK